MAGDWVKWEKGLENKPEVVRMASFLGKSRKEVAVDCMNFWGWADENIPEDSISENGSAFVTLSPLAGDNMAFIDAVVGTPLFADSMSRVGWLRCRDERVEFPNFGRHNGETAKTRARNAKNQKKKRLKEEPKTPVIDVQAIPPTVKKVTKKSPRIGDKTVTRGEERRVGSSNEETNTPLIPQGGDARVTFLEVDGDLLEYDGDPSRWKAEFIRRWNSLPGVVKHSSYDLSTSNQRLLLDRLAEPDWFWKRAFEQFPLYVPDGVYQITLGKFLQPDTVSRILEGSYDKSRYERTGQAGLFDRNKDDPTKIRTGKTSAAISDVWAAFLAGGGQDGEVGADSPGDSEDGA